VLVVDELVIKVKQVNFVMMNYGWNSFFGDSEVWILQQQYVVNKGQYHLQDPKKYFSTKIID
jgi:hypothetical protein